LEAETRIGGNSVRGRYAHEDVAYCIANWISTKFRIWMITMTRLKDKQIIARKDEEIVAITNKNSELLDEAKAQGSNIAVLLKERASYFLLLYVLEFLLLSFLFLLL
jgi:hypothetical protein